MKIRSAVPENGCLIFLTDEKRTKTKKNKKKTKINICKTYTHPPPTGRRLLKSALLLLYNDNHYELLTMVTPLPLRCWIFDLLCTILQ